MQKVQKGDNSDCHVGSIDSETLSLGLRSLSAFVSNKIVYLFTLISTPWYNK